MRLKIFCTGFAALMLLLFTSSAFSDSIEVVDDDLSGWNSLALDSSGNPVVSYNFEDIDGRFWVTHCNDVNCAGGDESMESFEGQPSDTFEISLALDSSGNPVVAFHGGGPAGDGLKVLHCNDVNCAGGNESIEIVDTAGSV
jgi:hypothetical protein